MKPRKMYVATNLIDCDSVCVYSDVEGSKHFTPVLVVPLDLASVKEMALNLAWEFHDEYPNRGTHLAEIALAALGITVRKPTRRRG